MIVELLIEIEKQIWYIEGNKINLNDLIAEMIEDYLGN